MDEASGNFFGKQLIRSYYFKTMSEDLAKEFEQEYDLSPDTIKENIYRRENPNTYLATFSRFLIKHKNNAVFQEIIAKGLDRFISHQILQFENAKEVPIHFIGSISFFLKEEIEKALKLKGLTMGRIVQRPIDELVKYHKDLIETVQ
jgi:hypothetical protein